MSINAGNKGLANLGNTCYMNSVLQCLSHLLTFHPQNEYFYEECEDCDSGLMYEWFQFQRKMWSNDDNDCQNPVRLLRSFKQLCVEKDLYFENFDQNDVDEFLTLFLDLLHQCIAKKVKINLRNVGQKTENSQIIIKGYETWKRFYEKDYSYIVENFYSQLLSLTICPECYYFTTNHDPIQVVSLEIPKDAKSMNDCFKHYTQKIVLDEENRWTCDKCSKSVRPHKKTLFFKTSDILIILLKRYSKYGQKIDRFIDYPMKLNLKDYNKTIDVCHSTVGKAILNTSITIVFGFSILILSKFIPTIYFGIFTGIAMLLAMISVLTLLPTLILLVKPFGK